MVNRSLACLRRMLRLAYEDGKIVAVPKIRLMKEPPARKGFLERTKFEDLLKALPSHLRALVASLYWCGLRKGEALQVDWSQVDLDARTIRLHDEQTKTGEARVLPLPSVVVDMLRKHEPKSGPLFDGTNLRVEWERACAAVGLGTRVEQTSEAGNVFWKYDGLMLHDLRRSAVRNLRLAGVSETVAMKISGHRTANVFRRYNIVTPADVLDAMRSVEVSAAKALPEVSAKLVQKSGRKNPRRLHAVQSKSAGA
jgi:integrase